MKSTRVSSWEFQYVVTIRARGTRKPVRFACPDLAVMRREVRTWIDRNGYGGSDVGGDWPITGHERAVRMSYNGRFWDADDKPVPATDDHECRIHVTGCYECGRPMQEGGAA